MLQLRVGLAAAAALVLGAAGSAAWAQAPRDLDHACAAVSALALPDTRITQAVAIHPQPSYLVPETAHDKPGPFGGPVSVTRPFCRVEGVVAPSIRFEVWLPLEGWNGRFEGVGLGAFLGVVPYAQMAAALAQGYAVGGTDTGHESGGFDATWAVTPTGLNTELVTDWAHRGIHEMSQKSEAVVRAVYGAPARYRYFFGCSSGGHQALTEAQRYPDDYDGILAGDPANYWTHLMAGQLWFGLATSVDPATNLEMPDNDLALIHRAALKACDANDGVRDGVIENPPDCHFDPRVLACRSGQTQDCLTAAQVQAVEKIYRGAHSAGGQPIYPGFAPGSELGWREMKAVQVGFAQTFYRYLVFQNPSWNYATMDLGRDVAYADRHIGSIVNSINPDLRAFRAHGGKLIHYHGWADPEVTPYGSVNYYNSVVKTLDGGESRSAGLKDVQSFYRLFMIPGMFHCRGGDGTDTFDGLAALQAWVEQGRAPQRIEAAKLVDGHVVKTRPLCPYPQVASYRGHGSTNDAANFTCALRRS